MFYLFIIIIIFCGGSEGSSESGRWIKQSKGAASWQWRFSILQIRVLFKKWYRELWQASKGINKRPINWCTSPMMIHKITQHTEISGSKVWKLNLMIQPIIIHKSSKLWSQRIRNLYYKTLGTSVISSSPMSPLSLSLTICVYLYTSIFILPGLKLCTGATAPTRGSIHQQVHWHTGKSLRTKVYKIYSVNYTFISINVINNFQYSFETD